MKRRILTIDDSAALQQFIQRALTKKLPDHALSFASAGAEGLGLAASEKPDLILLDYGLPDISGDEVCRGLQADAETAGLPIILMGRQPDELKRTKGAFENVIQTIPKPFTADQLYASVTRAFRNTTGNLPLNSDTKSGATALTALSAENDLFAPPPAKPASKYAADTTRSTLLALLLELERDEFTGLVTLTPQRAAPLELHLVEGRPWLVTTRDATAYLGCSGFKLTPKQTEARARLGVEQAKTGNPIFLYFAAEKLLSQRKALTLCAEQNHRLFASLWTSSRVKFAFEANAPLPSLTRELPPFEGKMIAWAEASFKLADQDLSAPRDAGKLFSIF